MKYNVGDRIEFKLKSVGSVLDGLHSIGHIAKIDLIGNYIVAVLRASIVVSKEEIIRKVKPKELIKPEMT